MTKFNKTDILNLINTNDKAVYRALVVLFERQTADEQSSEATNHLNGMGFNGTDARFGSSLAKQVIAFEKGESKYRYPLSRTQLEAARKMVRKYAGQLAKVANAKAAAAKPTDDVDAIIATAKQMEADAAAEARAEADAELAAERYYENRNEMAYYAAGYRD
jgi:hypothetical protein